MRAAVLNTIPGALEIEDLRIDKPRGREVLVRTAHSGLCHSDLHFMDGVYQGTVPAVMGHEGAGIVEAVGADVTHVKPGDHVIACLSVFCGQCRYCLSGKPHLCANRNAVVARDAPPLHKSDGTGLAGFASLGTFAEQMLLHENAVVKIREDMPLDTAALIGCGVTTGLGAVIRTAKVEPASSVAVVGCGGIGLAAVQGARLSSAAPIIAVDVEDAKLEQARLVGATHVVNAGQVDAVEAVKEITGGGVDYSFEAIGLKQTAEQCYRMLGRGGTAVIIGMIPVGVTLDIPGADLFMNERSIRGSLMGSNRFRTDMPWFVELYLDGRLRLDEMVSAHRPLDEINEGYDQMRKRVGTRTVIDFPL
ncbi:MAG TPA: Zn-dependent alcohol dehydrogenase [Acidimicrobiales bacterium]|jgi:S-(hydroxymethyl)glutathione dehydrogenase/alcohol dehydrogenase|nr:Zn-dependent alcohol dehydrogenase [Acidimicrobiales bacterium]